MILILLMIEYREHVEQEILSNINPTKIVLGLTGKELLKEYC